MNRLLIVGITLVAAGGAVAAVLLLRGAGPSGADGKPGSAKVRVAYMPNVGNAPLYVAVERGYFTKEGVGVELISMGSSSTLMPAFLAGEADVAMVGATDALVAAAKFPGAFKVFRVGLASGQDFNEAIVVKKGSPYQSIADLKGKRIGLLPGAMQTTNVRLTCEKVFGDRTAMEPVPLPASALLGSLSSGAIDAAYILEPLGMIGEREGVCQYLERGFLVKRVMDPFVYNLAVISQACLDKHPGEARAFIKAHSAGLLDCRKDPASTAPCLTKYTKVPLDIAGRVPSARPLLAEEYPVETLEALVDLLIKEKILDARPDVRKLAFEP